MQRLEVSGAVRLIYRSLGVKGLILHIYIYIYIYIYVCVCVYVKPFRALCHYNLVTGTNKQSYSNLNY